MVENRLFYFDAAELLRAVTMVITIPRLAKSLGLPTKKAGRVEFGHDKNTVTLVLHGEEGKNVVLGNAALAALLLAYCGMVGIPLPRNSIKAIDVTPDGVIFSVSLETHSHIDAPSEG